MSQKLSKKNPLSNKNKAANLSRQKNLIKKSENNAENSFRQQKKIFKKSRWQEILLICAPIIASLIFAGWFLLSESRSIWFDEAYSAYLIQFDFSEIWNLTGADVHPPLYYFLLKIWANIFGVGEIRLRAMSIFFGIVLIWFAWRFVRYKFGKKPAALAAILLAFAPILLRYGAEARMYTLAAAIVFAAAFVLEKALATKNNRYWILYAILLALGMWTHYFVAFAWLAQLIYLITIFRSKIFQKKFFLLYGAAILLFVPWIPSLLSQSSEVQSGFWIEPVGINSIMEFLTASLASAKPNLISGWYLVVFLPILAALFYFSIRFRKKLGHILFLAWLPPLFLIIVSLPPFQSVFVPRYLLYSSVAIWLILAVGAVLFYLELRQKISQIIAQKIPKKFQFFRKNAQKISALILLNLSFLLLLIFLLFSYHKYEDYRRDSDFFAREIIREIAKIDQKNLPILLADQISIYNYYNFAFYENEHENPLLYYWPENAEIAGSMKPAFQNREKRITNLAKFFKENSEFWYFTYSHEDFDTKQLGENLIKKKVYKKTDKNQEYQLILLQSNAQK